ncbi:hypothetical protein M758_8G156600 [Ceratodon purpureus]|nr:hypothetical protein M758_8G156600 [Ceratodon purpureus]
MRRAFTNEQIVCRLIVPVEDIVKHGYKSWIREQEPNENGIHIPSCSLIVPPSLARRRKMVGIHTSRLSTTLQSLYLNCPSEKRITIYSIRRSQMGDATSRISR